MHVQHDPKLKTSVTSRNHAMTGHEVQSAHVTTAHATVLSQLPSSLLPTSRLIRIRSVQESSELKKLGGGGGERASDLLLDRVYVKFKT